MFFWGLSLWPTWLILEAFSFRVVVEDCYNFNLFLYAISAIFRFLSFNHKVCNSNLSLINSGLRCWGWHKRLRNTTLCCSYMATLLRDGGDLDSVDRSLFEHEMYNEGLFKVPPFGIKADILRKANSHKNNFIPHSSWEKSGVFQVGHLNVKWV